MRILVDENIPNLSVSALRNPGHDVMDIRGTPRQGMGDEELWGLAQAESRALVTTDKGFVEHRNEHHHGLLVVRLRQPNEERLHARIMSAIAQFPEDRWPGLLVVVRDQAQSIYEA